MNDVLAHLKNLSEEYRKHLTEINAKIKLIEEGSLAKALVGKCFKYRNTYGNKSWYVYRIVRKVFAKTQILIDSFQEDEHGKIEFEYDTVGYVQQFSNATPIPSNEYFTQEKKLLNKMKERHERNKDQ